MGLVGKTAGEDDMDEGKVQAGRFFSGQLHAIGYDEMHGVFPMVCLKTLEKGEGE